MIASGEIAIKQNLLGKPDQNPVDHKNLEPGYGG